MHALVNVCMSSVVGSLRFRLTTNVVIGNNFAFLQSADVGHHQWAHRSGRISLAAGVVLLGMLGRRCPLSVQRNQVVRQGEWYQ